MTIPRSLFNGLHHEPTSKRIRAVVDGRTVLDSTDVALVWEHRYYPQYYVPEDDVLAALEPSARGSTDAPEDHDVLGPARLFDLVLPGGRRVEAAAWTRPDAPELTDHVRFRWDAVDQWFEEDEPVHVHPRDPHTRVDCLPSSRTVRIEMDGTVVAESPRPTILFETGLRPRYYLPPTDVRLDLLEPSDHATWCPYKGEASYHSVRVGDTLHENVVWHYSHPLRESVPITGMLCFYDERVDLYVDGEPA